MNKSKLLLSSWLMLLVVALQSTAVFAADAPANIKADPINGKKIFMEGKGDASACIGCHGFTGLGNDMMGAPRLANIGQVYIAKQLNDFATASRMPEGMGVVMLGVGAALSEQDRRDVGAYLESLPNEEEPSDLKSLAADGTKVGNAKAGKQIVTKGIKGKVPACQDCHGFNGRSAHIPMINQQKYVYLVNQLTGFKNNTRTNDPKVDGVGIMQGIAKKLSGDNIADIAAFLSTAPRVAPSSTASATVAATSLASYDLAENINPLTGMPAPKIESADTIKLKTGDGDTVYGKSNSELCQGCHGEDGNSIDPLIPKLAGQYDKYIAKQLRNYQAGIRTHQIMNAMAATISDEELADISSYFASNPTMKGTPSETTNEMGKNLFLNGKISHMVVACVNCHGVNGKGLTPNTSMFPVIGGQHKAYLSKQLYDFKRDTRFNSPNAIMNRIVRSLSDEEIDALAEYISGL